MPMATIFIVFLMISAWALFSASQQWGARRDVFAVASSAARAGAQADPAELRLGGVVNADGAMQRAQEIIAAAGYIGSVTVDGNTVTVTVTAAVEYAFPSPGFPAAVSGSASAVAQRGVTGDEGG